MKPSFFKFPRIGRPGLTSAAAIIALPTLWFCTPLFAAAGAAPDSGHGAGAAQIFLWIALLILGAKVFGMIEKFGQPAVLGEILFGVLLGNLTLIGFHGLEPLRTDPMIHFLAELGVVLLLFQVGLETTVDEMRKVGIRAFLVACVGVVVPFALGTFVVGPLFFPDAGFNAYLFLGATLTATSVGITARVFQDLGKIHLPEARIVLGAAVIDDVLGLIILAVVSLVVTTGAASPVMISWITLKAFLFLAGSLVVGRMLAPVNNVLMSRFSTAPAMKLTLALATCLLFAYAAHLIELAPIVGAFAAGLVLTPFHFKHFDDPKIVQELESASARWPEPARTDLKRVLDHHKDHHAAHLVEPVAGFLVPIFFIMTGFSVRLETLFDAHALLLALGITAVAVAGKIVAGLAAGKVDKWVVGVGMVPRGEVGLIFAMMGMKLGVVSDEEFAVIVIMVMLTTILTPPALSLLINRHKKAAA